jgi:hypothetical protein
MARTRLEGVMALSLMALGVMVLDGPGASAGAYSGAVPAAGVAAGALVAAPGPAVENVQYRRGYAGPRYVAPRFAGPRGYYGPRPYYGPPRVYGGPAWAYRPWNRRPYYGTIIGGIALGTIVAATAYGLAPPRPRPDLCWYWADEFQSRGYWDYC